MAELHPGFTVITAEQIARDFPQGQGAENQPGKAETPLNNGKRGPDEDKPLGEILQVTDAAWDPDRLPPRPWIAPPYILRKHITLPHGPGGVGKSQLIASWVVALALAEQYGRLRPIKRCRVLLANFEDDKEEQELRLSAALKYFGKTPKDLEGYLYRVTIAADADATMFELDRNGAVRATRTFEAFDAYCRELRPDVAALDTLVAINAIPEDNNTLMRRVMAMLRRSARAYEMGLLLAHHDRKGGGDDEDNDQANARGGGDIVNAARFELAVKKMTKADAEKFGVSMENRSAYFRLGSLSSKLNYVAADESEWFERVTHVISGQPVVACIPWKTPDAFEGVSTAIILAIIDDIEAGMPEEIRYSNSNAAKERAAWPVVVRHIPSKSEKDAKRMINKWVKNGVFISKKCHDEKRGEDVQGLFANPAKRPG